MSSNFARMNVRKKFGDAVRQRRHALEMSQEDLAAETDLDRTYISGIERGLRNPTLVAICNLAKALRVSPSKLIETVK